MKVSIQWYQTRLKTFHKVWWSMIPCFLSASFGLRLCPETSWAEVQTPHQVIVSSSLSWLKASSSGPTTHRSKAVLAKSCAWPLHRSNCVPEPNICVYIYIYVIYIIYFHVILCHLSVFTQSPNLGGFLLSPHARPDISTTLNLSSNMAGRWEIPRTIGM